MGLVSFYGYMVQRDERPAVTFEAVFNNEYVAAELHDAREEGFDVEVVEGTYTRITYLYSDDEPRRPWVYREFYPVVDDEPTVGPRR